MTRLVNLWCNPRTASTALMYSFRQRSDTAVVDEPLYAAWLARHPDAAHPGREDVLSSQPTDPTDVVRRLLRHDDTVEVRVAKQMAAHLEAVDPRWLDHGRHVVVVRDPTRVVASYTAQVRTPSVAALGYPAQVRLVDRALRRGERPVVVDSDRLLADPQHQLGRVCELLGLAFDPAMLSWPSGPIPEDGVWAPYWYGRTHSSTGFLPPRDRPPVSLSPDHAAVAVACQRSYERIARHAL